MQRLPGAVRREQLLQCAEALFARRGYARATTAELAKAAGVTEPIIYRHFPSKRALFIALIERTADRTLRDWEHQLAGASDPVDRLRRLLGENPMVSPGARDAYRVILQAITEIHDDEIQRALSAHIAALHKFLVAEVKRAQNERKVARVLGPEIIAWLLIHVGLGFGVLSALLPHTPASSGGEGAGMDIQGAHVRAAVARILMPRRGRNPATPTTPNPPSTPPGRGPAQAGA